jgi:hypothetical protein
LLLLNTREWRTLTEDGDIWGRTVEEARVWCGRTLAEDGDIWGRTVEEARVWCGLSHQWWRKLSACILRTLSEYKVGGAYIQSTVQTTAKVSLMTVDLNTKLMTVLNAGNSVQRLKTWNHWNWILMRENVELSNIKWGSHCIWHNSSQFAVSIRHRKPHLIHGAFAVQCEAAKAFNFRVHPWIVTPLM